MSTNSSVAGYLQQSSSVPNPGGLTLLQFLQSVFVGISGLDGTLVRPKWQPIPPKQLPLTTDWIAIGLGNFDPDYNAATTIDINGVTTMYRHQVIELQCSVYGPNAYENMNSICDGFQLAQNREALLAANMGFVAQTKPIHMPELVNENWCDRYEATFIFRKENVRVYPVLSLLSASGVLNTVIGTTEKSFSVNASNE